MEQKLNETEVWESNPISEPINSTETENPSNELLLKSVLEQQLQIKRSLTKLQTLVEKGFKKLRTECDNIKSNIQSLNIARANELRPIQPAIHEVPATVLPNLPLTPDCLPEKPAELMKKPKNLFVLWREYVTGIDGNKPAKDFKPNERGKQRSNYSRRKSFWSLVEKYNKQGIPAEIVIEKLYKHYGRFTATTTILRNLVKDREIIDSILNINHG